MFNTVSKYFSFAKISFREKSSNLTLIMGMLVILSLLLLTYNQLWVVVGKESNNAINHSFIWYLLLAETIILSAPRVDRIFDEDIRSGNMAYFINKPVSFFFMRFSEAVGEMTSSFITFISFGGVLTLAITHQVPFEWKHLPIILAMCYFSCLINLFLKCACGMSAIWFSSTRYLNMVVDRLGFVFGGAIIPLSIYPEWFVNIAQYTPFYSFYYLSLRLVYEFSWENLLQAITLNIFWSSLLCAFIFAAYRKLGKRTQIYGG
ncbi:MAG: hypothetical protein PHE89_08110 [Alphaproteobacteria bacterium]|nr:hypothetical protein [Alphaproteobacteria bacterium]